MLKLSIPGFNDHLSLQHLVLDFNGTIATDGHLVEGVNDLLTYIAKKISIHVVTGDTYGSATIELAGIPCKTVLLSPENQALAKQKYVMNLDPKTVVSIGNGLNDSLMLKFSAIGIAIVQDEGAAAQTLAAADIICNNIFTAIELIKNPIRLLATLRQ